MNYLEIDKAMVDITRQKCIECKERFDAIPKENAIERKALQIEYGMYTFCGNCGLLFNVRGERTITHIRRRFFEIELAKYPRINDMYKVMDEEEKLSCIAALQAEMFIRSTWLGEQYAELSAAESSGDMNKAFEFKIKIGAVENMFSIWEAWRAENHIYPNMIKEG